MGAPSQIRVCVNKRLQMKKMQNNKTEHHHHYRHCYRIYGRHDQRKALWQEMQASYSFGCSLLRVAIARNSIRLNRIQLISLHCSYLYHILPQNVQPSLLSPFSLPSTWHRNLHKYTLSQWLLEKIQITSKICVFLKQIVKKKLQSMCYNYAMMDDSLHIQSGVGNAFGFDCKLFPLLPNTPCNISVKDKKLRNTFYQWRVLKLHADHQKDNKTKIQTFISNCKYRLAMSRETSFSVISL